MAEPLLMPRRARAGQSANPGANRGVTTLEAGKTKEIKVTQKMLKDLYQADPKKGFYEIPTGVGLDPNTGKPLTRMGKIKYYDQASAIQSLDPHSAHFSRQEANIKARPEYTVEYDAGWDAYNKAVAAQRFHVGASARNARASSKQAAQSTFLVAPKTFSGGATDETETLGTSKKLGAKPKLG